MDNEIFSSKKELLKFLKIRENFLYNNIKAKYQEKNYRKKMVVRVKSQNRITN